MIDLKEFVQEGFLFECNRRFFHPLGLALTMELDENGYHFVGFQDFRTDPEGCLYCFNEMTPERRASLVEKGKRVAQLWNSKAATRIGEVGSTVEPLEGVPLYE